MPDSCERFYQPIEACVDALASLRTPRPISWTSTE